MRPSASSLHAAIIHHFRNSHSAVKDTEVVQDAAEYEPQLKYSALGGDVPELLSSTSVTCLCLSDKILALGTEGGRVHVLDYEGNEVSHPWHPCKYAQRKHAAPCQRLEPAPRIPACMKPTHTTCFS